MGIHQMMFGGALPLTAFLPGTLTANSSGTGGGSTVACNITLASSGAYTLVWNNSGDSNGTWLTSGANTNFQCRMTLTSGSLVFGTTGSWLGMTSNNSWGQDTSISGTYNFGGTLEIRRISDSVVVATSTISIVNFLL
jgi:hypothetical protein